MKIQCLSTLLIFSFLIVMIPWGFSDKRSPTNIDHQTLNIWLVFSIYQFYAIQVVWEEFQKYVSRRLIPANQPNSAEISKPNNSAVIMERSYFSRNFFKGRLRRWYAGFPVHFFTRGQKNKQVFMVVFKEHRKTI